MSIYGALRAGVAGLNANSQRIAMISDNIANVNTNGYKRVEARFSTFVTETQGSRSVLFSNGGVRAEAQREIGQQGIINPTNNKTDLAIQGQGYFVVTRNVSLVNSEWQPSDTIMFTRAGGFRPDENGNLRNDDGHYLLSWPTNADGARIDTSTSLGNLRAVSVGNQVSKPIASSLLTLGANLLPQTTGSESFRMQYEAVDRKGRPHTMNLYFERIGQETQTLFFTDGTDSLDKQTATSVTNGWRIYARFADETAIQTFDAEGGNPNLVSEEGVPLADVVFDSQGRMSNIFTPGALSFYQQTALPINDGTLIEGGAAAGRRYDLSNPAITANTYREVARILTDSGVPAGTFSTPPTAAEIMDGIELLDTGNYPDSMGEIMAALAADNNFENAAQRTLAGYAHIDQGIDALATYWFNNGTDAPGEGSRENPNGPKYLASRLISGANGQVATTPGSLGNDILSFYSNHAQNKVRITIDYDNNSATNSDLADIDIDFGSMTMAALESGGAMNRSASNVNFIGVPGNGNEGLTQYHDEISTVKFIDDNGKSASNLANIDVSDDGIVTGRFENGEARQLGQIPLVTFSNPNGLAPSEGLAYIANAQSGDPLLRLAGSGGSGKILASALESSAVDIAEEFSNMIVTQRGFSASAKILSTAQAMIEELSQRF